MNILTRTAQTVPADRMLTRYIQRRVGEALAAGTARRQAVNNERDAKAFVERVRQGVLAGLGPMPFGKDGGPLSVQTVARHDRDGYGIENVLLDSFPGAQVNANIYVPAGVGPFPAVVCACGHSGKAASHYQFTPQVFARNGYIAVAFDATGCGEKTPGNDHFTNGVQCYLTGAGSSRYFLMDGLRVIDYLLTRNDVDGSRGVAMTGVSGGGVTTMLCTVLDQRIACAAPVCCIAPFVEHPAGDLYTACPEDMAPGKLAAGIDVDDLISAAWPRPVMMVAGERDEVFLKAWFEESHQTVWRFYSRLGDADKVACFIDQTGHTYSVAMAERFVAWMNRWLRDEPDRPIAPTPKETLRLEDEATLACHPSPEENMFTINRALSKQLAKERRERQPAKAELQEQVRHVLGLDDLPQSKATELGSEPVWSARMERVIIESDADLAAPMLCLRRVLGGEGRRPALLYLDERGKFERFQHNGLLGQVGQIFDESDRRGVLVASIDAIGWGETQPERPVYDLAGWCSIGRLHAYLTSSLLQPVLGMRVRDVLAAVAYLRARPDVDADRIVLGGWGLGAVVALHAAVLDDRIVGFLGTNMLASLALLAENDPPHDWPPEAYVPCALRHYDLPDLLAALAPRPAALVNPLDHRRCALTSQALAAILGPTAAANHLQIHRADQPDTACERNWLEKHMGQKA